MPDVNNLKNERLTFSFRGLHALLLGPMHLSRASWWQEGVTEKVLLFLAEKERGGWAGIIYSQGPAPSDLLSPKGSITF
jgi:hypothetical protein